ncbi:MAG TPA: hypothetical protein VF401_02755 [Candidatus Saccharimonadales bacterium]
MAKKTGRKTANKRTSAKVTKPKQPKTESVTRPVKLPNVWQLTKTAWRTILGHWRLFLGITLVYGLLNLILVQGLATGADVNSLKQDLHKVFSGDSSGVATSLSIFIVLVGSAGNGSNQTAGAYQLFLAIITSLAVIWALRQVLAGNYVRIRDAYYKGMYPLIPFILVTVVIGFQLVPALIGSILYTAVSTGNIAVTTLENVLWAVPCIALFVLSLYFISSSMFALYIVTLPDMTPLKALRSARDLVRRRRWAVLRKLLALPVILLIVAAIIMVPIILWVTAAAQWIFFALTMFALVGVHAYSYTLYRELLND